MSLNIPQHYILQYDSKINLAYQFAGDKLANLIQQGNHEGEGAAPADYVGPMTANENPGRLAPTPSNNATVTRRWVYPTFFDNAVHIAKQDITRTFSGGGLQDKWAEAQGMAMSRKRDDLILAATASAAQTGKNGGTSTPFDTNMSVANNYKAAAATGLTIAKLIRGKKLLQAAGVDITTAKLLCVINSDDHEFLLNQIELRSKEYNDKAVLVDGMVQEFLGIQFIHIEYSDANYYPNAAAALVVGSDRYVMLFDAMAMYWGNWSPITVEFSIRADLSNALQLYATAEGGATRLQEGGVVRILCQ